MSDTGRLSLNQATVKGLPLSATLELCRRHDIGGVGVWRESVAEVGLADAVALTRRSGRRVTSLCRGGFFTHAGKEERDAAVADNLRAIEEAAALEADVLVLVSGGLVPGSRDLGAARAMIADGVAAVVPRAIELGVRLGIEALHPVFCAERCALVRLADALAVAEPFPVEAVGVVVDSYHVWWDAGVLADIARARARIAAFQVSDWVSPLPADNLNGRVHVGDGVIDFAPLAAAVEAAGYRGHVEVEIFNQEIWAAPPDETAATVKARFLQHLA
jgi:sugar phosphate isomerase/epimerase